MPQSLAAVYLHIVFSTKNREPFLRDKPERDAMHEYLGGIAKKWECAPIRVSGVADHVHLLVRFGRTITIADLIKELKRGSNLWLQEKNPAQKAFEWQAGYSVFSVSQSKLEDVVAYIANQEEHHKKVTFQDELRAFFKKHNVEFDERYVWD
jgi:REP element-mobilizing transposase RayT